MPTTVTSTIGTTGRTYSTLQAWEDACPADLVADDKIWRGECYNDSEFTDSVVIGGITTDATRYIDLTAAAGQSFQDHASVRSNALTYNPSNGVGLTNAIEFTIGLDSTVEYTRVSRLQYWQAGNYAAISLLGTGSRGKDLIIRHDNPSVASHCAIRGKAVTLANVAVVVTSAGGNGFLAAFGGVSTFIGCVAVRASDQSAAGVGFSAADYSSAHVMQSCAVFGFTSPHRSGGGIYGPYFNTSACSHNATDQASGLAGSNNQHSVTFSASTPFVNADSASLDVRAVASTALAASGFRDATNAPNDISGTARSASPTIGVWELTGGGGPAGAQPASYYYDSLSGAL